MHMSLEAAGGGLRAHTTRAEGVESRGLEYDAGGGVLRLSNTEVVVAQRVLRLVIGPGGDGIGTGSGEEPSDLGCMQGLADASLRSGRSSLRTQRVARLAGARVAVEPVPELRARGSVSRAGEVRREMLASSCLSPDDARMILGRRVSEMLEGGRMARLAPERRAALERLATTMGLRPFDSNLVIAIAQDAARHGEALEGASGRLALVKGASPAPGAGSGAWAWGRVAAACVLAAMAVAALARWIGG